MPAPQHLDLLIGVKAIAAFVFGEATPTHIRKTRYWLDLGRIPAGKIGTQWAARREDLEQWAAGLAQPKRETADG